MHFLRSYLAAGLLASGLSLSFPAALLASANPGDDGLTAALAGVEKANGGRLGVSIWDIGSGAQMAYRGNERFAMCSTFKALAVAAILKRVDGGTERLDAPVAVPFKPLLHNSPVTELRAGLRMSVAELCAAAITHSDNTAANLLIARLGGPGGVTAMARSLGDAVTRLDRIEPDLNEGRPGDPRDTTSPNAFVHDLDLLILGNALSRASRAQLTAWMSANTTGAERLRAGLPGTWKVADKTGSNGETTSNDVAVVWPKSGAPILIAVYVTECPGPESKRNAMIAQVARLVAASAGRN